MAVQFPNAQTIRAAIFNDANLNSRYYSDKGVTKAVADLVVERFSDKKMQEVGVNEAIILMMHDLIEGIDGFTGKPLPNLEKLGIPDAAWKVMEDSLKETLLDCAIKA